MMPPNTIGKPIECKAAVCWEPNKPLRIETVTIEPPKHDEIRVKMVSAGICATDISYYKGNFHKMALPFIPGHEGNAIVESVGEGVDEFQPGDCVIPLWNPECGLCERCKNPKGNLCDKFMAFPEGKMLDGTTRISLNGNPVYSQNCLSTFSEYSVSYKFCFVKINPEAPLLKLATFGCCVPTGFGAAVNTAKVHRGSSVVVWGLGAVGLCVVLGCKRSGASKIIGVDINMAKFEIGKKFGVTDFLNPSKLDKPIVEVIHEMTEGGADYSFLSVGNRQVCEDALLSCHPSCGTCVHLAVMPGNPLVGCRPIDLIYGRTWKGSFCGGYRGKTGIPKLVDSYMAGELPEADLLITNIISLDSIQDGFEDLMAGKQIRMIVQF